MPESNNTVKFAPGIKFIVAVYTIEIAAAILIVAWLLSRAAP